MQQVKLRSVAVGRSRAALVPPGRPAAYFAPRQLAAHAASTPPAWNPQNVPNPKVMPSPSLTPEQAVAAQMEAISRNDDPWVNHGLQTCYEFCEDAGSMERSRYFGFSKDLYHFDHFMGMFRNCCEPLVNCQSWRIQSSAPTTFRVDVVDAAGQAAGVYEFSMVQHEFGLKKGCWMTKSLLKVADS